MSFGGVVMTHVTGPARERLFHFFPGASTSVRFRIVVLQAMKIVSGGDPQPFDCCPLLLIFLRGTFLTESVGNETNWTTYAISTLCAWSDVSLDLN